MYATPDNPGFLSELRPTQIGRGSTAQRIGSVWCSVLGAGRASERATRTLFQRDAEGAERRDQWRYRRVGHQ
eukprot:5770324-Prymnesium_polylepis.1